MDINKIQSTWWSLNLYDKKLLDLMITSTDIEEYAYILHDKDINPETKEPKKFHYHLLIHFIDKQRGSWFKRYQDDDTGTIFREPVSSPQGAYNYLIHDTPTARKQGKFLYDPSERISTIDKFDDVEKEPDENEILFADIISLVNGETTWFQFLKSKPKRVHQIANIDRCYERLSYEFYGDNKPKK